MVEGYALEDKQIFRLFGKRARRCYKRKNSAPVIVVGVAPSLVRAKASEKSVEPTAGIEGALRDAGEARKRQ
jgi:hypothetical protein